MSTQNFTEPGDVKVTRLMLFNKDRTAKLSLMPQLISFSVYEDIMCPCLYAEIELVDAINIVEKFPIVGEEFVEIEFVTPSLPIQAVYSFAVTSVKGSKADPNAQSSTYTLVCVSEEQIKSAAKMIQVAGAGTYSEIVKDILVRELETTKPIYVEDTKGLMGNVVPKLKPFAAIDYIRQMAVSTKSTTSAFLFFETQLGFQFRTIESLMEQNQGKTAKQFKYVSDVMSTKEGSANAQRNIIKYEVISRTDTIDKIQSGVLNNVVSGYDLITKELRTTVHNIAEDIKNFVTPDKKARAPLSATQYQDHGTKPADIFFMPFDSSKGGIYRDLTFAARRAYTSLLMQNVTRILIHGDSALLAGDLIEVEMPSVSSDTGRKKQDTFVSGKYMITRLRHLVVNDVKIKHMISADIIKVGYSV